jgi:hypothetical protein
MRKWRSKPTKYISTRPIFKEEYPKLIEAMIEDGLTGMITAVGVVWYHGDYQVSSRVVCGVWNITESQMKKLKNYIYSHDPFVGEDSG